MGQSRYTWYVVYADRTVTFVCTWDGLLSQLDYNEQPISIIRGGLE